MADSDSSQEQRTEPPQAAAMSDVPLASQGTTVVAQTGVLAQPTEPAPSPALPVTTPEPPA